MQLNFAVELSALCLRYFEGSIVCC